MPSGEANIRQFLYGQRFFQKEFGIKCKEVHMRCHRLSLCMYNVYAHVHISRARTPSL